MLIPRQAALVPTSQEAVQAVHTLFARQAALVPPGWEGVETVQFINSLNMAYLVLYRHSTSLYCS